MKRPIKKKIIDLCTTLAALVVATLVGLLLQYYADSASNVIALYMLAILFVSIRTKGYLYGIIAAAFSVLCVNYFFTYPYNALNFTLTGYPLTFLCMLVVAIMAGTLAAKLKDMAYMSSSREQATRTLYEFGQELLGERGIDEISELTLEYINRVADRPATLIIPGDPPIIKSRFLSTFGGDDAIAEAIETGRETGYRTDYMPQCPCLYMPVATDDDVIAVAGLYCRDKGAPTEEKLARVRLLLTQVALALSRQLIADKQKNIQIQSEREKLRGNLLRSISHDLRTPLTSILGASGAIMENDALIDKASHDKLIADINEDAAWLLRMVENILAITRVGSETQLKKTPEAVEEVVAAAVNRVRKLFPRANISVAVPDEFLMIPMDGTLIAQVLINLMENAIRHSGDDGVIELSVATGAREAMFAVRDHGRGLDMSFDIFEGFFGKNRENCDDTRGLGIGLSLCRTIIQAHGGEIYGENHPEGGAIMRFTLPQDDN